MGMKWTKEQMQVIALRDKNLLVSAAAGSGKTAVLVERIIGRILDPAHPVDIDRMLIVTFTSAAAAEMRARIGSAIDAALERDPANAHLLQQSTLIHHAQITTIHSFCLYLIRNYFHQVDLEPNFRIAEEGECSLLQEDVMADVLNRNYEKKSSEFLQFVECFATGKKDDGLKDMILKLYHVAMSNPWPKEWLANMLEQYQFDDLTDLSQKPWMRALTDYLHKICASLAEMAEQNLRLAQKPDGPLYLEETAKRDLAGMRALSGASGYSDLADALSGFRFERLLGKRGYDGDQEALERLKACREEMKGVIKKLKEDFFFSDMEEMARRLRAMAPVATELVRLTGEFMDAYDAKKRKENLLDFDDLEHFALKILVDEEIKEPTEVAISCRALFAEVMVDEYQDSNLVQESLLAAVSGEPDGRYNRFMVGDVKQSIYRFRLARPELFMEKYDTYKTDDPAFAKVELHKNFRSRREVLEFINGIFFRIMKKDLGNVAYDEASALYPGAEYPESNDMQPELLLADSDDPLLDEAGLGDPIRLEAELAAARIRRMIREQTVTDAKTGRLRQAKYSDIVILLRSFGSYADTFLEVLEQKGIPAHAASKTGYFQAQEVQTVLCLLRVLDNPRQDIPLAAVLRSPIGGFSDEELAVVKAAGGEAPFHCCVLEPQQEKLSQEIFGKLQTFLQTLSNFRGLVAELPIHDLLCRLLEDTGYMAYAAAMPGGERRQANLYMLLEKAAAYEESCYRGLFHFIRYMDKLQKYEVDYGEADVVNENANAVRLMTIHKSKGLEFPIVFLCGITKPFNRMDTRGRMVIHPDLGIGLDYIDPNRRIFGTTIYKKAVARQMALEDQGEELRVLYVALTRAKEKLVITGAAKGMRKKMDAPPRLTFLQRARAGSYFDWIYPAAVLAGEEKRIQIWGANELVTEEVENQWQETEGLGRLLDQISCPNPKADQFVQEQLSYQYPDLPETTRRTKYAVSELKHRSREAVWEEGETQADTLQKDFVPYVPQFAGGENQKSQGALRGIAMHRAAACLPVELLAGNPDLPQILDEQTEMLVKQGRLNEEMSKLLQKKKLLSFYRCDLALRMKAAAKRGELSREQPFVMGRPADEVEGDGSDTMVLIQGIIDAFFIEDGEIVLLDYKTDAVRTKRALIERYQKQLDWYQKALESNLGRPVKEKVIYSFALEKAIWLP